MKRTPEQEAARRARSARDHSFPKCRCGNVARKGEPLCGRCAEDDERDAAKRLRDEAFQAFVESIKEAESHLCEGDAATAHALIESALGALRESGWT